MFSDRTIGDLLITVRQSLMNEIKVEKEDYILSVDLTEYCDHLTSKHKVELPIIEFDNLEVDSIERDVPAEYFPRTFDVRKGQHYKRDVIRFHIPYFGNIGFLKYRPTRFNISGRTNFETTRDYILLEYINFNNDKEKINNQFSKDLGSLKSNYENLKNDIQSFNDSLIDYCQIEIEKRKRSILQKNEFLLNFGVPIKENKNVSKTFSIPFPKVRKKINVKPKRKEHQSSTDPTLDNKTYIRILEIIHDVGEVFQNYPSTYKDKKEEDLRDYILLFLQPNFDGASVTGETFNKRGKTDILIKYEGSNVFIGECKVWKGSKQLHSTIDQLLRYSTWRDTKSAIIFFVNNKGITSAIDTISSDTKKHQNYLGFVDKKDENWFNFKFHLNGDKNREIKIAVLIFHIPKIE